MSAIDLQQTVSVHNQLRLQFLTALRRKWSTDVFAQLREVPVSSSSLVIAQMREVPVSFSSLAALVYVGTGELFELGAGCWVLVVLRSPGSRRQRGLRGDDFGV